MGTRRGGGYQRDFPDDFPKQRLFHNRHSATSNYRYTLFASDHSQEYDEFYDRFQLWVFIKAGVRLDRYWELGFVGSGTSSNSLNFFCDLINPQKSGRRHGHRMPVTPTLRQNILKTLIFKILS